MQLLKADEPIVLTLLFIVSVPLIFLQFSKHPCGIDSIDAGILIWLAIFKQFLKA